LPKNPFKFRRSAATHPVNTPRPQPRTQPKPVPKFKPANIDILAPQHRIELGTPSGPAYDVQDNKICRQYLSTPWLRGRRTTVYGLRSYNPNARRPLCGPNKDKNGRARAREVPERAGEDGSRTPGRRVSPPGSGPGRISLRPPRNRGGRRGGGVASPEAAPSLRGGPTGTRLYSVPEAVQGGPARVAPSARGRLSVPAQLNASMAATTTASTTSTSTTPPSSPAI
uniref:MBD domain-containing protein n=1 Tax=Anisakis simplex TaxID=6269 RepID=A0A0M3K756_ANISI